MEVSAFASLVTALTLVATFLLAAWRFAKPSVQDKSSEQAAFQERLIKDNQGLHERINKFQLEIDECERGRHQLENKLEEDRLSFSSQIYQMQQEIYKLQQRLGPS